MLAHWAEKQCCAEAEGAELRAQAAAHEAALVAARDRAAAAKKACEAQRRQREGLGQDWRIVADPRCLADVAVQRERLVALQGEAAALRAQWEAGSSGQ